MSLTSPAGLWLLTLAVPIIALHVLRSRRTEVVVASTLDWEQHDRPVSSSRPWQRLRWSIPLVLQLLAVALLALALSGPVLDTGRVSARRLVVMVDTSASMGATDGSPDRISDALDEVVALAGDLGSGATVSIVTTGAPAEVVATDVPPSEVASSVEGIEVSEGGFDGEVASSLALGLDRPDRSVGYVLVTDGGLRPADVTLLPAGTEVRTVGEDATNLGVTNVVVSDAGASMHVQVTVDNADTEQSATVVRVDVDGRTAATAPVTVEGRSSLEVGLDVPAGERIDVHLDSDDLLDLDDHVYAVGPEARTLAVLQVGPPNPFLDALLGSIASLEVTRVDTSADLAEENRGGAGFDIAIFDGVRVDDPPVVPWWSIASVGMPGVELDGEVESPVPVLVRSDTDLLAGLDLSELAISEAQRLSAPSATTMVGAEDTALLVSGRAGAVPFVHQGFSLEASNLGLLPTFPVLAERILRSIGGSEQSSGALGVGDRLDLDVGSESVVIAPSGTRTVVPAGGVPPELDRAGIWTVESEVTGPRAVVVNPAVAETDISPTGGLGVPGAPDPDRDDGAPVQRSLLLWVLLLAVAVVAAEWWFAARRRGVPRRQWRVASGMRAGVLALIVLSLVVPVLHRPSTVVSVIVVLDVSDSMSGTADEATEVATTALARMPKGSSAGVVVVGGDAKVDASVSDAVSWSGPRVTVDGSATDLAAGLRIAGAIAPRDHARRILLISDGRSNTGDLDAEVTRLERAGVRLDVVPIESTSGPDVMVAALDAPSRARSAETVELRVRIAATTAQLVTVALQRDGVEVDRRIVDAPPGESELSFLQPAGSPGFVRWSASVSGPANGVTQNDRARSSTRVEGSAELLLVEGAPGESGPLAEVLTATGAEVTVVAPEELPDLTGLAASDAIVLVDVPASSLSRDQVAALVTATRELGTGLLTVGGTSSYGAGDYLGSELESLLPVVSEVKDPTRRSKVAQVFAVDVSGSMGACHCAEDGANQNGRHDGGVEKSDIAREAATLAVDGIAPGDELGVLALDEKARWLMDLAPVGDGDTARTRLAEIDHGDGATNLAPGLTESAARLRESDASLRHIVLFTDGFEDERRLAALADEAATLRDEGITVSVMGTGEGSAEELRLIADSGGGRFYPGRDLQALPDLLLQETKVVSRQLIVEGEFLPEISSGAPEVASLGLRSHRCRDTSASTARPTATQHLRVGPEQDPLLTSWQVGLGKVSSWTSDAGGRWAGGWTSWDGAPQFWAGVVRSVATEPEGSLTLHFERGAATATAIFDEAVPDGATVTATVTSPSGTSAEVPMRRLDDRTFEGDVTTGAAGTYGVGAVAVGADGAPIAAVSGAADLGYSPEYLVADSDPEVLEVASTRTGGRGAITAEQAFDAEGLEPGRRALDLTPWLLLLAALLWPVAVAVSRLRFPTGPDAQRSITAAGRVGGALETLRRQRSATVRGAQPAGSPDPAPSASPSTTPASTTPDSTGPAPTAPASTTPPPVAPAAPAGTGGESTSPTGSSLESLLEAKRRRRED